jgi:predicted RNase H-like nuclease (RuvC/YqgF family)
MTTMIHPDATIDECFEEISALEAENERLSAENERLKTALDQGRIGVQCLIDEAIAKRDVEIARLTAALGRRAK